jgi:hypothetical protein
MKLMPDGAIEVINEWALEKTNLHLIEFGENIFIDVDLAKEILNDTVS